MSPAPIPATPKNANFKDLTPKMRLTEKEIATIRETVLGIDQAADIYAFSLQNVRKSCVFLESSIDGKLLS